MTKQPGSKMGNMTHHVHAGHKMAETHGGHDGHVGHSVAMFRDKFWLSLILTIPVVFWSTDVQHWLGYKAPSFPGSNLIAPILGTFIFVYGGRGFLFWGGGGVVGGTTKGMGVVVPRTTTAFLPLPSCPPSP